MKERFIAHIHRLNQANATERRYHFILVLILRLRQLASHVLLIQQTLKDLLEPEDLERLWKLCREARSASTIDSGGRHMIEGLEEALLTVQKADPSSGSGLTKYLQALRKDGRWGKIMDRSVCVYCGHLPTDPHITACFHIYCKKCLDDMEQDADLRQLPGGARCLACSIEYSKKGPCSAYTEAENTSQSSALVQSPFSTRPSSVNLSEEEDIDWYTVEGPMVQSAKTRAATIQIDQWFKEDPTCKIIVFTQFRGIIRILDRVCDEYNWGCAEFHGGMPLDARETAILQFSTDPECKILLAAMKAGGVGLNLTAANRCIIIDLWWNSSVEQQAFCRMFRIGQERDVKVVRFATNRSIDGDIIRMQDRKTAEIEPVLTQSNRAALSTTELLQLFGMEVERDERGKILADGPDEPFIFPQETFDPDDENERWKFELRS